VPLHPSHFFVRTLTELSSQLVAGGDLTTADVEVAAGALASSDVADEAKADFLTALAKKGETAEEVAAFAVAFRARAINPGVEAWAGQAIDIVGTGGDHAGGFNISSLVVLVLASAGVTVMKHGNRGITSKCGSADLLAGLGVNLEASPEKLRQALDQLGFVFFFAPAYHPTFKHIGPVRKLLAGRGQRTVFNILGPLINPGRPAHVLLGTFSAAWVPKLAGALDALGAQAGLAAHGVIAADRGIDELTTATVNRVRGFGRLRDVDGEWHARDFGLKQSEFADLTGGDLAANLAIVDALTDGRGPVGLVDTIVLNAAVALWIVGRVAKVQDGLGLAREQLVGGAVKNKIAATREFYRA
jgi:anthranilate phosphoribosyltransferase